MIHFDRRNGYEIILLPNANLCILSPSKDRYSRQYKELKETWEAIDNDAIEWDGFLKGK